MLVAYLDESARDARYYYMGALLVDDESIVHIESSLNRIAQMIADDVPGFDPSTEFHGYELFHGKGAWGIVNTGWRVKASKLLVKALAQSGAKFILRGLDVDAHRAAYSKPYPPHELTTAHVFESIETHMGKHHGSGAMALVVADEHHTAPDSRRNLRRFRASRVSGYTSKKVRRVADTIYFGPSHASRLLQMADIATYFLNRYDTVTETDPRATAAMEVIHREIMKACVFRYVWSP